MSGARLCDDHAQKPESFLNDLFELEAAHPPLVGRPTPVPDPSLAELFGEEGEVKPDPAPMLKKNKRGVHGGGKAAKGRADES